MSVIANLLIVALYIFLIILFVRVLFSWISPYPNNSLYRFTHSVTEPVLAPVRRRIPSVSGYDISPIVVWLVVVFVVAGLRTLT
jgi:YggT family protein